MNLPRLPTSSELAIHRVDLGLTIYVPLIHRKGMTWSFSKDLCVEKWNQICGNTKHNEKRLWHGGLVHYTDGYEFIFQSQVIEENIISYLKFGICGYNGNCITGYVKLIKTRLVALSIIFQLEKPVYNIFTEINDTFILCQTNEDLYETRHHPHNPICSKDVNCRECDVSWQGYEDDIRSISMTFSIMQSLWNVGRTIAPPTLKVPVWLDVADEPKKTTQNPLGRKFDTDSDSELTSFKKCDAFVVLDSEWVGMWLSSNTFDDAPSSVYEMVPFMLKAAGIRLNCEGDLGFLTDPDPRKLNMHLDDEFVDVTVKRQNARKAALTFIFGCKDHNSILCWLCKDLRTLIGQYIWNTRFNNEWA